MVRQHVPTRPNATGRSLKLFQEEGIYKQYRYSCFITSLDLPCEQIWTLYRQRADAENSLKSINLSTGNYTGKLDSLNRLDPNKYAKQVESKAADLQNKVNQPVGKIEDT